MRFSIAAAALFAGVALAAPTVEERHDDYYSEDPIPTPTPSYVPDYYPEYVTEVVTASCAPDVYDCVPEVYTTVFTTEYPYVTDAPVYTPEYTPEYTTSVVYTEEICTITTCPPEVYDCPADYSTVVTSTSILYTTVCPVEATETPVAPVYEHTHPAVSVPVYSASLVTVSSCVPTVTYPASSYASAPAHKPTYAPAPSGYAAAPKNASTPVTPYAPAFTGAASSVSGSMAVAGFAALAALILA